MQGDIRENILCDLLYFGQIPIFELRISFPQYVDGTNSLGAKKLNGYYRTEAETINRTARKENLQRAIRRVRASGSGTAFPIHSLIQNFYITRNDEGFLSIVVDRYYYCGGSAGKTIRRADLWDKQKGTRVPISRFFLKNKPPKTLILKEIERQILVQQKENEIEFFKSPLLLARKFFQPTNLFLTNNGLTVFFPQGCIASAKEGILCYKIPLKQLFSCWKKEYRPKELSTDDENLQFIHYL